MKKASYSPFVLIALFLILGGTLLISTSRMDSGFNLISGFGVFDPVVSNVLINSTHGTNSTNDNLTVYWTSTDDDGERVTNITDWRAQGAAFSSARLISFAILYFPFENSTVKATDYSSPLQTNGTVGSAISLKSTSGKPGFGMYYNWSTAVGDATTTISFTGIALTNSFTVSMWIKPFGSANKFQTLLGQDGPFGLLFNGTTNALNYRYDTDHGSASTLTTGAWSHIVAVNNAGTFKFYINGVKDANEYTSLPGFTPTNIGWVGGADVYKGGIDDVRVYNRTLNVSQIIELYRNRTDIVVSQEITNGDVWLACITPNDGTTDGTTVCSNNVTVVPIGINNITVSNITNQSAAIRWNVTAFANGTLKYGKTKSLGTKQISSAFDHNHSFSLTSLDNNTLYYYNVTSFNRYGTYELQGVFNFTTLQSNFPPQVISLLLNTTLRLNMTSENITAYWNTTDANGDKIINITEWRINGKSFAALNMPFENDTHGAWTASKNVTDYSIYGNNGTVHGAQWISSGHIGGAYNFSGGTNITLPTTSSLKPAGNFTIEHWVYRRTEAVYSDLVSMINPSSVWDYLTAFNPSGIGATSSMFYFYSDDLAPTTYLSTSTISLNRWHHIVMVYKEGQSVDIYLNGKLDVSNPITSGTISYAAPKFIIGADYADCGGNNCYLDGLMDDVRIYNRSLSAAEISILNLSRTDIIHSDETNIGENWSLALTPNDGTTDGTTEYSNNITIRSSAPTISLVHTTDATTSTIIVNWTTNVVSNTTVKYGTTLSLGTNRSVNNLVTHHNVSLTGLSAGTTYYYNVTSCYKGECSLNGTHSFTTSSAAAQSGNGGGGGAASTEAPSVIIPSVPVPAPVTEAPKPAATTSITDSQLSKSTIACSENATAGNIDETTDYSRQIMPGYELLVNPFKLDCKSSSAKLTFSVPDSYTNITALKCFEGKCGPVDMETATELKCGAKIFEDITRKTNLLTPEMFPVEIIHSEINQGETELVSGNTQIIFAENTKGKIILDKMSTSVPEAKNARIRITGTPVELTFETPQAGQISITLPYVVPEHVDELSTAIYILNKSSSRWIYIGGDLDKAQKTVSVSITDIAKYSENNKAVLAPMALLCLNCFDSRLEKIYDGGSRDSVVLVHGFENSPERFEDIINDIKLTKQPWQAWTFGYPSNLPIEDTAKDFADLLQLNAKDSDFVYIAAHSMGGLIAQQAIRYAYEQNQGKANPPYSFVNKIIKVVLIAAPNKGALSKDPSNIFNTLLNADTLAGLFNVKSKVISDLIDGKQIAQVPGVQYLVIAGTQSYEFSKYLGITEKNDGLITVSSAQTIGGEEIANACYDFWAINATHTNILNNYDSRKLVERIVAAEIAKDISNKAIMGHSQYFDLEISSCTPNEQYVIIGTPLRKEAIPNPGLCSCGNGVCGADENEVSCPNDCAKLEKPKGNLLDLLLHFKPLRNLAIGLVVIVTLIILLSRRRRVSSSLMQFAKYEALDMKPAELAKRKMLPSISAPLKIKEAEGLDRLDAKHIEKAISKLEKEKTKEEIAAPDYASEKRLNNLLLQARICLRTGKLNGAAMYYSEFSNEYGRASTKIKEKFKEVAVKLKEEVKRKMT
ncbi:TPA: hypothetical protein HA219_03345 [Candidatus Woesearchaeota archaeon]|nr:hypothetical protein [Candidatus Woesearchaeota archaeon]